MPAQPQPCAIVPRKTPAEASQEDQLRQLLQQLSLIHAASPEDNGSQSEEILVDIELDGWRYLLIRTIPPSNPLVQLSPREQEIVRMVAVGHPNKVIAAVLNISSWTVGTHLRRIFAKLGVASRAAMVARCMDLGNGTSARTLDPFKTVAVERKARAAQ
jgi:DNA-binding CsgD family transcriptional regulator